jgi:HSP20 family protein
LIWAPESDLVEKDGKFEVQMAVPGFEVKDMQVAAAPDTLIVRAEATHKHEQDKGNVYFCEFGDKELFRRFDLPRPIDVDQVTANLDKGVLHITAAQITAAKPREKAAAAAA